ncbi:MAG TPA: aldo/keto reductase [Pirellulales bacterium]|nr:aldo/keto reductase [Pirellulales bacterium]
MERRDFLRNVSASAAGPWIATGLTGVAMAEQAPGAAPIPLGAGVIPETSRGDMRYRKFGRSNEEISIVGVGGFHIGNPQENEGIEIIRSAIDRGITFMDNCWDYHDGDSERRMGKALADGYRDKVFLMTKIDGRTRDSAARQINESLERLKTDRIDLLQLHEIIRLEDPDRIFARGGAIEAVIEARQQGKIRYIGFTGHKDPLVHLRMLEVAAQHDFEFDSAQMPLNVMDAHFRSFARHVVPDLVKRGIAVLGMKPLGSGNILRAGVVSAIECLHYAMSLPTATVITGMDSMKILDQALEAVRSFKPLDQPQIAALLARTAEPALSGHYELFKTDAIFDGTAQHPEWLG